MAIFFKESANLWADI